MDRSIQTHRLVMWPCTSTIPVNPHTSVRPHLSRDEAMRVDQPDARLDVHRDTAAALRNCRCQEVGNSRSRLVVACGVNGVYGVNRVKGAVAEEWCLGTRVVEEKVSAKHAEADQHQPNLGCAHFATLYSLYIIHVQPVHHTCKLPTQSRHTKSAPPCMVPTLPPCVLLPPCMIPTSPPCALPTCMPPTLPPWV
eukprot:364841-Chlamydomonas_euryale.AAC.9